MLGGYRRSGEIAQRAPGAPQPAYQGHCAVPTPTPRLVVGEVDQDPVTRKSCVTSPSVTTIPLPRPRNALMRFRLASSVILACGLCSGVAPPANAQDGGAVALGCSQLAIARGQTEIATNQTSCDQAYQAVQDEWCAQAMLPSRIAVCRDPELRALALERNKAYYDAQARLDPGAVLVLFNDQAAWGGSYAQACGIKPNAILTFPLAPQIKKCMARAGRDRLAYLRSYGAPSATITPTKPPPTGTEISDDYRGILRTWLESHKRYPEAARQRGEKGRVGLRFSVDRSGCVLDYVVYSSSGYPDLDAAGEAMIRGAILPPFPADMTAPEIEVSVTVDFGLQAATGTTPAAPLAPQQSSPSLPPVVGQSMFQTVYVLVQCYRQITGEPHCDVVTTSYAMTLERCEGGAALDNDGQDKLARRAEAEGNRQQAALYRDVVYSCLPQTALVGTYTYAGDGIYAK